MAAETPGEEELQETVRRSDERIKGQEIQIAELRERLQEAYEAHRQNATEITEHGAHAEQQHAANMFFDILSFYVIFHLMLTSFELHRKRFGTGPCFVLTFHV